MARPAATRSRYFPPADGAGPEGLVAVGGLLEPDWLRDAYRHGIFPWPSGDGGPMLWWSPDPRAVIELDGFHVSKSLRKTLRSGRFTVTADRAFAEVMRGCATAPNRRDGTWITPEMHQAYCRLHTLGDAHSVEAWADGQLAGGVYGVALGAAFAAESMFHYQTDASKVALAHLVAHLRARGFELLDIQQWTPHTGRLGATEVRRAAYLRRLARAAARRDISFGDRLEAPEW